MLTDTKLSGYTYKQASAVLVGLGFELAPPRGGSHRKWRRRLDSGHTVVIGLVEAGTGPLKQYLIRDMLWQLQSHKLIPGDLEASNGLDA
jgi:hypothetical protein